MSTSHEGLGITIEDTEAGQVIRVRGELDLASAPELTAALSGTAGESSVPVVLDLAEVSFIDSSALRALVLSGRELSESGRTLQIGPRSEMVARVLEMTHLDQHTEAFQVLPEPA